MSGSLPSSLVNGRLSAEKVIVCVDVPDIDNFLMVLRVIRDHPKADVNVVLSPRPVSFATIPYGEENLRELSKKYKVSFNFLKSPTTLDFFPWPFPSSRPLLFYSSIPMRTVSKPATYTCLRRSES